MVSEMFRLFWQRPCAKSGPPSGGIVANCFRSGQNGRYSQDAANGYLIERVVGPTELESVTSCVSSRRSNQLSYGPGEQQRKAFLI